jgi:hypothetical protein
LPERFLLAQDGKTILLVWNIIILALLPMIADFLRELLNFLILYVVRPVLLLIGALFSSLYNVLFASWIDNWKRKPSRDGFPQGFRVQRIGIMRAVAVSDLSGPEIVKYLREHPETAKALLGESYDKRYTPSTFIFENGDGSFRVGWLTRGAQHECVKEFENLADAATDYLLFSLGKSRWTPTK